MKRLMVFGVITLAVISTLLIAAGSGWNDGSGFDPNSHENVPNAVVKNVTGNDTTIYFGELIKDPYKDRYLMVVNSNSNNAVNALETLTVTLCPGPGKYSVVKIVDEDSTLTMLTDTTNENGQLPSFSVILGRGQGVLFHIIPETHTRTCLSIASNSDSATYAVNGRKLAVDRWGRVHVCYNDVSNGIYSVSYARSDDGGSHWLEQKVADSAICPAIAVDTFGIPWISYMAHPTLKKMYLWSEGFDTAAIVVTVSKDSITNAPAIALDFSQGVGVVYYSSKFTNRIDMTPFELPSVKVLSKRSALPTYAVDPMSCCITNEGKGLAAGRFWVYGTYTDYLVQRSDRNLTKTGTQNDFEIKYSSGNHGDPSIGKQGSEVWAAYGSLDQASLQSYVRYIKASPPNYSFPDGNGTQIAALASGYHANSVQIAEEAPIVVWSRANGSSTEEKIYYSYCLLGDGSTWSDQARVTNTGSGILERYPHVALDYQNQKVYMIWTEISGSTTIVKDTFFSYGDMGWNAAKILTPNGPPQPDHKGPPYSLPYYVLGTTIKVEWLVRNDEAETSFVYANYNYNPSYPGQGWVIVDTAFGNSTTGEWKTTSAGTKCRAKVVVKYPGGNAPYDISDADFEIRNLFIKPTSPFEYDRGSSNILAYTPSNSLKTVSWEAFSTCGLSSIGLQVSKDGSESFTSYADSSSYDSTLTDTVIDGSDTSYAYTYSGTTWWTTPATPTSNGCLRMMAVNNNSDTAYSDLFDGFAIAPPGGNRYATSYNQRLIAEGKASGQIGIAYRGQATDTSDPVIYYINSDEGLDFDEPDSIGLGILPAQDKACVAWVSEDMKSVKYSNWNSTQQCFNTPTTLLGGTTNTWYTAPPAIKVISDTVHVISIRKVVTVDGWNTKTTTYLMRLRFLKDYPGSPFRDSVIMDTISGYDTTGQNALLYDVQGSNQFLAFILKDTCRLVKYPITGISSLKTIGKGICPTVSCSQGNITYSYISNDSTSLIRLWGYRGDTSWVQRDTIPLDTSLNYETMTSSKGLMFGAQHEDTSLAELYVYDPISEELYSMRDYEGYYPHPYIDNESSEFGWVDAYSEIVDSETVNLHTERQGMNVIIPELYLEARDKRSPFTIYRDTCIHYSAADVDSGTDSLKYRFPYLDDSKDYTTIVEFYTDEDIADTLEITLGSNVDTISIPGNNYSWYEQNIASNSDTMNLKIKKLSVDGFIPVSRVMVRERSDSGLFMMKGRPIAGPEKIVFCLFQPNPNPFSDAATIRYSLPYETNVSLKVYDISGRLVNTLVQGKVQAGVHSIRWEGKDNINRKCASGVYFVRFVAADYRASKKMVMLK